MMSSAPTNITIEDVSSKTPGSATVIVVDRDPPLVNVGIKLSVISILALIQLGLFYGKIENEATFRWGACFVPTYLFLALWLFYMLIHARLCKSNPGQQTGNQKHKKMTTLRLFLSVTWKVTLWIFLFIFVILLTTELDKTDVAGDVHVNGAGLIAVWMAFFVVILCEVILYALISCFI